MAESARGGADGHNDDGEGGSGGGGSSNGRRSRTDSTQGRPTRTTGKRNRAALDAENDAAAGNSNSIAGGDASSPQDDTVATPAPKQRRGLYGRVSGLVGRAVGLLTPGRPRRPDAAAAVASPSSSVAEGDAEDGVMEDAVDGGRRGGSPRSSLSAGEEARGRSSLTPQGRSRGGTMMAGGGGDEDSGGRFAGGEHREEGPVVYTSDGMSRGVEESSQQATGTTSSARASSSRAVRDMAVGSAAAAAAAAVGPLATGENFASFSPGILKTSQHQGRNTRARTRELTAAAAAASQAQSRGAFGDGLGFESLRGSTGRDGLDSSRSSGRAARGAGTRGPNVERAAMDERQGAFGSLNEGWGTRGFLRPDNGNDVERPSAMGDRRRAVPSNGTAMVQAPNNRLRQNDAGAGAVSSSLAVIQRRRNAAAAAAPGRGQSDESADVEDPPFTPTELRDLVRSLRFRRGLPPAAAVYLLSKLESRSAALVREQILDEHRDLIAGLQGPAGDAAAGGGAAAGESRRGGAIGEPRARSGTRGDGRGTPLVAPVARRRVAPPGADLAPSTPLRSPAMMPPPPRGLFSGVGGSAGMPGEMMPPPPARGEDSVDLLTPARRRALAEGRNGRERSFAQSTPGGDRVWKPAETANQGTPWAARARPRARPGGPIVVVEDMSGHGGGVGLTPRRQRSALANGPGTPAAMARRIISVLDDAGSPRSPLRLTLPGLSPAPDSVALRSRRSAEDGPLPTRTLSVPHPTGGGDSLGAGAPVTPARLPKSRWVRMTDTQRRREQPSSAKLKSGAAETEVTPSTLTPQSRKRKPIDQGVVASGSAGGEGEAARSGAVDANGAGGRDGLNGDGGAGARAKAGSAGDPVVDETETSAPRNKRARTNSEALTVKKERGGNAANGKDSSLNLTPASRVPKADDDGGGGSGGTGQGAPPAVDAAVVTRAGARTARANGNGKGEGGTSGDTAKAAGNGVAATPGQQQRENLTEEERRLEARRRGRKARSPYVHEGERVDPNAGLPTSIRPTAVLGGLGGGSKAGGDGGRRESVIADATKTPSKYWTCRGCYVRNYDMTAKECDMCRRQKNFGTPHHVNPRAVLPGGRTLYAVRQGLEAVGMATPGQDGRAAGNGAGVAAAAAVGADGDSGSAAATTVAPSLGSSTKPVPAFQFGGPAAESGGTGSSSAPAAATTPVVASTPAPAFSFGAGVAPSTLPATAPAPATPGPKFSFGAGTAAGVPGSSSDPTPAPAAPGAAGTVAAATPVSATTAAPAANAAPSTTPAPAAAFTFGAPASTTGPAAAAAPPAATVAPPAACNAAASTAAPSNPTATAAAGAAAAATPSFTFGAAAVVPVAPVVAATATSDASAAAAAAAATTATKPSFTFGNPSVPTASGASTAAPATATPTAPAFSFGAPAPATATAAAAPAATTTSASPAFAFGGSSTTAATPAPGLAAKFTFGGAAAPAPAATTAPAQTPAATAASFTFGGTAAPAAAAAAAAPAGAAQAVGTPAKAPLFGAPPVAAAAPAAPAFSFGASAPAAAAATPAVAAGAGIASRLGPVPTPAVGGVAAPTPSAFPGFGGAGFGAAGGGTSKRAPSPAVGGFGIGGQPAPKRGPSPANSGFGTGAGFGAAGMRAPATGAAPGAASFSFGQPQQQPAAPAGGMFGVAGAAPQPTAQAPAAAFAFGGTPVGGAPAQAAGGFGAHPQPGQFGAVAPAVAAAPGQFGAVAPAVAPPAGFGAVAGGFGAPVAGAPAFSLGAGTQPNPATRNRRIVKGVRRQKPRR